MTFLSQVAARLRGMRAPAMHNISLDDEARAAEIQAVLIAASERRAGDGDVP